MVSRASRIVWWCSVLAGKLKVVIFKAIQVCWTWCDRELQFWGFFTGMSGGAGKAARKCH